MAGTLAINQARNYVQRYGGWAVKVSSAILDQAFFSGSGFIINVLLARWMSPDDYGAYVVAFAWFLLAQNLYDAAIIEPMAVYGPGRYFGRLRAYFKYVFYGHIAFSVLIFIALTLGALLQHTLGVGTLYAALLGTAISAPFMLLRWLTRQPFYVISRPHLVVLSGVMYTIIAVTGLFALHQLGSGAPVSSLVCSPSVDPLLCNRFSAPITLNAFWAQILLAFAALIPSIYNVWLLNRNLPPDSATEQHLHGRAVVTEHIRYGKWSVPTRFLVWASSQMYYLILPLLAGLSATASLRALNNLVLPVYLSMGAISGILTPTFVRVAASQGKAGLDNKVKSVMLLSAAICGVYFLGIVLLGAPAMHLLYDGKYDDATTLPILIFLGLSPILSAAGVAYTAALRALERIKESMQTYIVTAIFTLTVGLACTVWFGVLGAMVATFFAQFIGVAIVMRAYYKTPSRPVAVVENPE